MSWKVPQNKKKKNKPVIVGGKIVRGRPSKPGKRVPIQIKGLGTFYVQRKWVLIGALGGTVLFLGILVWLWWLWTIRIPEITR